jgi:hypothetical protein
MEQPEGSLLYSPERHTESGVESDESSHHSPAIFVISICPSARKEQRGSHWTTDFHEI